jgi:hypothetical protein
MQTRNIVQILMVVYCWQRSVANQHIGKALFRSHGNNSSVNASQFYVIYILPLVLLKDAISYKYVFIISAK